MATRTQKITYTRKNVESNSLIQKRCRGERQMAFVEGRLHDPKGTMVTLSFDKQNLTYCGFTLHRNGN